MEVVITARHFRLSPKLREYVGEKFNKLLRLLPPNAPDLHVTLLSDRKSKRVEVVAGSVRITQESDELLPAIELAADRLKEKLRKDHGKRREHKGRMSVRTGGSARASIRRVAPRESMRTESHEMAEIEVEVAARKFEKSKKPFMIFVSSETGQVNVLYRKPDGKLTLIETEPQE